MPDFENICKEKHIDSHRSFNNRIVGLSNQCVGFSEEDYQKLRELKAEDISLLEIKAFVDSQKSVCAHQKKEQEFSTNHQSGGNDEKVLSKVLLEGSVKNSAFVLEIQDRLRNLGYLVGGVDGNYAEMLRDKSMGQTAAAIFRFQKDHNISPTGKMDVLTYTALSLASPETTFGMLAGAFESPTKGMESIGWDESGGTSYGRFQFSSRSGVMDSFVKYLRTCDAKANSLADKLEGSTFVKNRTDMHSTQKFEKAKKDFEEGEIAMKRFAKRMMLILTAGCLLCLLLAGCMSDKYENSEYVGVWKATTGSMGGINVNVAKSVGGEFTLDLQPNGDVKAVVGDEKGNGDWEETANGFKIKDSSGEMVFVKVETGKVKTDYSGMTILFEKQAKDK